METNSLVNLVFSRSASAEPVVGLGATILGWTDRYPATVIAIHKQEGGKAVIIEVQEDSATRIDKNGMSEDQEYEYSRNPSGRTLCFKLKKDGRWVQVVRNPSTNRWNNQPGKGILIGVRKKYHDFSF